MGNQTTNGKTLLDLIKKEHREITELNKKSKRLLIDVERHEKNVSRLIKRMSKQDLILYNEHIEKLIKNGLRIKL